MSNSSSPLRHLDDSEIIRELDAELPDQEARAVRQHLAACWQCRTRKADLSRATADFVHHYNRQLANAIPPADAPRHLLAARLSSIQGEAPAGNRRKRLLPIGLAAAVVALAAAVLVPRPSLQPKQLDAPDPRLSPGVAALVNREYVCRMAQVDANGISAATAEQVFRRYRIHQPVSGSYEIDYVIPPALGGSQTLDNLWPQPYDAGQWNSHIKDALEQHLETSVCSGDIELHQAQSDLTNDWIAAYKRYFHADRPRAEHLSFTKDRPWQFAFNTAASPLR